MDDWLKWTQLAANIATGLGVVGLIVAYRQLKAGLRGQREATALGIWKDYLQLAMDHPKFSLPQPFMTGLGKGNEDYKRYEWFVSAMLFAAEQILALEPDDAGWRSTVEAQLSYHRLYLASEDFESHQYSHELQRLISKMTAGERSRPRVV